MSILANNSVQLLRNLAHSPLRNYAIPGLTSHMVGTPTADGTIRLFESTREHQEPIAPHSHRFNFECLVLRGQVRNRIWRPVRGGEGDPFSMTKQTYLGKPGEYERADWGVGHWAYADHCYEAGQIYSMEAKQVHSIFFSRGALVLFFEGPQIIDHSVYLEPYAYGERVPTMRVEPWMFQRVEEPS